MKYIVFMFLIYIFSTSTYAINCFDYKNQHVAVMKNLNMSDAAAARALPNGQGVIYYNPDITRYFSNIMLDFVYAHECAHHALGHGVLRPINEQEADCWAIRTLAGFGLNRNGLSKLQNEIATLGGSGDWSHAPGIVRARNLFYCLR